MSAENVVLEIADVTNKKTWFDIAYCTECYTVIYCNFRGRLLNKNESTKKELSRIDKHTSIIANKGYGMSTAMLKKTAELHKAGYNIIELNDNSVEEFKQQFRCKKCKVTCLYAPGIGEYCPKCGRDWGLESIKQKGKALNKT